jgi:hypothetical protein
MHTHFLNLTNILLVTRFHDLCSSKTFLMLSQNVRATYRQQLIPRPRRHVSHPRTLPSCARHVLFTYSSRGTSFPNYTPGHLTRGPAAIHEGSPLSFSRQNVNTKHHGRTLPARVEEVASWRSRSLHHHYNCLTMSTPNIYVSLKQGKSSMNEKKTRTRFGNSETATTCCGWF